MVIKSNFLCHFHFETEFMWTNLLILWKSYWQLFLSQTLIFRRGSWKCGLLFDCPYNFRVNWGSSKYYGRWYTESIPSQRHSDPKSIIHLEIQLFQIAFLTCFFFNIWQFRLSRSIKGAYTIWFKSAKIKTHHPRISFYAVKLVLMCIL